MGPAKQINFQLLCNVHCIPGAGVYLQMRQAERPQQCTDFAARGVFGMPRRHRRQAAQGAERAGADVAAFKRDAVRIALA